MRISEVQAFRELDQAKMELDQANRQKDIEEGDKPKHTLVILDDLAFSGALKDSTKHSVVNKIFCNSRHINMSLIHMNILIR